MLKFINLKEGDYSVDSAIVEVEIEVERSAFDGTKAIKVLHGYGSHGKGGVILRELRKQLRMWKKQGKIRNYFPGDKWSLFDEDSMKILQEDKSICNDVDLDKSNPGITLIHI